MCYTIDTEDDNQISSQNRSTLNLGGKIMDMTESRPRFGEPGGRQVRTLRGIKPDRMFIQVNLVYSASMRLIRVVGDPYQENEKYDGVWWVKVDVIGNKGETLCGETISLQDFSVFFYSWNSLWTSANCLLRTQAKTSEYLYRTKTPVFQPTFS